MQAGPGDAARTGGPASSGIFVSDAPAALLDAVVRLLRLLDEPRDRAVLTPLIKREILWRLITGEQGATVRRLGLADSSLSHVSRAVRWIREHYAQPFRVEDVARMSGTSASAFYRNLRQRVAIQPGMPPPVRRTPSQDAARLRHAVRSPAGVLP